MLDYHLHLLRHGDDGPYRADEVRAYAIAAGAAGIEEIAVTEHLFRFRQADALLRGWWEEDASKVLREQTAAYWCAHATGDLDEYVEAVLDAAGSLPDGAAAVRLGLEVDHYPGRMPAVADLLAGFPFDLLLGSVHWLGAWGFDQFDDPVVAGEWAVRTAGAGDIDKVWDRYCDAIDEMAGSGTCDVLAHPDLVKVTGALPEGDRSGWYERMAWAAAEHGVCAEISSAGWRKPVGEHYPAPALLEAFHAAGVGVTTASDAHERALVGSGFDRLREVVVAGGYTELAGFVGRQREARAL